MDNYITGITIKKLRERAKMTQAELASILEVSDKTISKWETGKGLPDITLIEPLAQSLKISVTELFAGDCIINGNTSGNMIRSRLYVCPICQNVIHTTGEAMISCCGVTLPSLEAEEENEEHFISIEKVEDESFLTVSHEMKKEHYISFIAYVTSDKFEMVKLYPEGNAQARFKIRGHGYLYCYCNKHGLIRKKI